MLTWVGTTQSVEGLRRTKRSKGRVKLFSLWNVQLLLLSDIKASSSLDLWARGLNTAVLLPTGFQVFGFGEN